MREGGRGRKEEGESGRKRGREEKREEEEGARGRERERVCEEEGILTTHIYTYTTQRVGMF